MNNDKAWPSICGPHYKKSLLAALSVLVLAGCNRSPDRPSPPQAPPRPQVMEDKFSADVQRAVFSYSSKPSFHIQDGRGKKLERLVIHT
jgi:uncharacterized lipoprotein YajG